MKLWSRRDRQIGRTLIVWGLGLALVATVGDLRAQGGLPAESGLAAEEPTSATDSLAAAKRYLDDLQRTETHRHSKALEALQVLRDVCDSSQRATREALVRLPGDSSRQGALDDASRYLEDCARGLHVWLGDHRASALDGKVLASFEERLRRDRQRSRETDGAMVTAEGATTTVEADPWRSMFLLLEDLNQSRRERRAAHLDEVLELLDGVAQQRWKIATKVSDDRRSQASTGWFTELLDEIEALPEIVRRRVAQWRRWSRAWPAMLTELVALRTWLWESLLLLVTAVLWWRWRRRGEGFWQRIGHWFENGSRRRSRHSAIPWPAATKRLLEAGSAVWTSSLDAFFLGLVHLLALHRISGAGAWVLMLLLGLAWRLVPALTTLCIASPIEQRPALMVGNRRVREQISLTVRSILAWWLAWLAIWTAIRQGLASVRLYETAQLLARWSLLLLVIFLLDRWAPLLRRQVLRLGDTRWSRWLGHPSKGRLANLLKAIGTLVYLFGRLLAQGVNRLLGGKGDLSWWTLRLARSDLQENQKVRQPLKAEERRRIHEVQMRLARTDDMDRLQRNLATWQVEKDRGLTALIGDRGSGKSHFLERVAQRRADGEMGEGLEMVRWQLDRRVFGTVEALRWMLALLQETESESGRPETPEELTAAIGDLLQARPPSLFLVDDVHYLVLRTVGGFDAFKAIKTCMYASSDRHFWVLGFHRPAWSYLEAVAVDINLDVFRTRVQLGPWKEEELATWLSGRTGEAGFELDFSKLVRSGPFDETSQQDLDRARQAYWQLLTNASSGNPEVALLYWLDSLCHESSERRLAVTLFEEPSVARLANHGDRELFVLAALWMHGRLDPRTLVDVLNMPLGKVEMACRHLDSIDVLNEAPGLGYALEGRWRPPVERLLRQRNFLHWEG